MRILSFAIAALPSLCLAQVNDLDRLSAYFADAALVSGPEVVACDLSDGSVGECFELTVSIDASIPVSTGPFCPITIDDGPDTGGIWFVNGDVVNLDGAFITSLAEVYNDATWQLYDQSTGRVFITDTQESCEAAARPDVDEAYYNYCVECALSYVEDGSTRTYTIPLSPTKAQSPSPISAAGLAHNGVRLDGAAPVDAILSAYTIAAFDDCGGHVNLVEGYHYHAVTDCLSDQGLLSFTPMGVEADIDLALTRHGAQIGIALDGYPIFGHMHTDGSAPEGLDECYGHEDPNLGYHYHVGKAGSNANLGCHTGLTIKSEDTRRDPPPPGG